MKSNKIRYVVLLLLVSMPCFAKASSFSYDNAIRCAQHGNWKDAHAQLNTVLVDQPDNADLLYDAGVAAYNLNNYNQAVACFTRAAECTGDKHLRTRSYFNAGNASVDDKQLENALAQYDKALALEPTHEYARHNRDRVKQMLDEQKKQEEQQQKDDQENNDDQKDNDDQQQNNDSQNGNDQQQKGDQQQGDQNDDNQQGDQQQKDNQSGNQDKQQKSGNQKKSDKNSQRKQGNNSKQSDGKTERKEQGDAEEHQKNSAHDKERNGDHQSHQGADNKNDDRDQQQGNKHGAQAPEKKDSTDNRSNVSAGGEQEQEISSITDPWLLNILNNQELQDKAINKQLMEAKIRQHGGKNGQNCW